MAHGDKDKHKADRAKGFYDEDYDDDYDYDDNYSDKIYGAQKDYAPGNNKKVDSIEIF